MMIFQFQALSSRRSQREFDRVNLRRHTVALGVTASEVRPPPCPCTRGLRSSTFRLNVSTICGIRWVHEFPPVY